MQFAVVTEPRHQKLHLTCRRIQKHGSREKMTKRSMILVSNDILLNNLIKCRTATFIISFLIKKGSLIFDLHHLFHSVYISPSLPPSLQPLYIPPPSPPTLSPYAFSRFLPLFTPLRIHSTSSPFHLLRHLSLDTLPTYSALSPIHFAFPFRHSRRLHPPPPPFPSGHSLSPLPYDGVWTSSSSSPSLLFIHG